MMTRAIFILSLLMSVLCKPQAQVMMLFSSDSLFNITSPLDLDSLFYWFAADVGVTDSLGGAIANNEGVGTWNDLSGNGYHVTQTTNGARPVYKATGGPGSKPCIQFDGSNDFLASAAHWWGSDDLTVIVVMKFANATRDAEEMIVSKNEATGNTRQIQYIGRKASNNYRGQFQVSSNGIEITVFAYTTNNWKHTNWALNYVASNGSTAAFFKDGSGVDGADTSVGGIYDSATPKFAIGANNVINAPTSFFQGSISEIIVYSKALSAAEQAAIETYLNRKYDLY